MHSPTTSALNARIDKDVAKVDSYITNLHRHYDQVEIVQCQQALNGMITDFSVVYPVASTAINERSRPWLQQLYDNQMVASMETISLTDTAVFKIFVNRMSDYALTLLQISHTEYPALLVDSEHTAAVENFDHGYNFVAARRAGVLDELKYAKRSLRELQFDVYRGACTQPEAATRVEQIAVTLQERIDLPPGL